MFQQVLNEELCTYKIPADLEEYLKYDDGHLWSYVCQSAHPIAQRIKKQQQYKVAFERHGKPSLIDLQSRQQVLQEANLDVRISTNVGVSYKTPTSARKNIYALGRAVEGVVNSVPLSELIDHQTEVCISRLFVPIEQMETAHRLMREMNNTQEQVQLF